MRARRHGIGARGGFAFAAALSATLVPATMIVAAAAVVLAVFVAGCGFRGPTAGGDAAVTSAPASRTTLAPTTSSVSAAHPVPGGQAPTIHATLVFGGDLLMHMPLGASVLDPDTGHYDFSRIFAPISPYLAEGDLAAANLETVLAGADRGYTNYPRMNSPTDLAAELAQSGFDLVSTANNHALDQGWDGLVFTADALDAAGMAHAGTYRSIDERTTPLVRDVGGVKVAFLAYADRLNGLPLPKDRPYAVSMLERRQVSDDVGRARAAGAELVVAQVHWGSEYMRQPSRPQREEARMLLEEGVDVIVGSHPHVVQPIVTLTVDRGGRPFTGYVAYSLGNLVSTQIWRYSDSGLLLYVDIERGPTGAQVTGLRYLPVYVQRGWENGRRAYRVVPVSSDIAPTWTPAPMEADRQRMNQVGEELGLLLSGQVGVTAR